MFCRNFSLDGLYNLLNNKNSTAEQLRDYLAQHFNDEEGEADYNRLIATSYAMPPHDERPEGDFLNEREWQEYSHNYLTYINPSPLFYCVRDGLAEFEVIIREYATQRYVPLTLSPFIRGLREHDMSMVQEALINKHYYPSDRPYYEASRCQDIKMQELIFTHDFAINPHDVDQAAFIAISKNDISMLSRLRKLELVINDKHLMHAMHINVEIVITLINMMNQIEIKNSHSAALIAISLNDPEIFITLSRLGFDLNAYSLPCSMWGGIHTVSASTQLILLRNTTLLDALFSAGANIHNINGVFSTQLYAAVPLQVCSYFATSGRRDAEKNSLPATIPYAPVLQVLINHGADYRFRADNELPLPLEMFRDAIAAFPAVIPENEDEALIRADIYECQAIVQLAKLMKSTHEIVGQVYLSIILENDLFANLHLARLILRERKQDICDIFILLRQIHLDLTTSIEDNARPSYEYALQALLSELIGVGRNLFPHQLHAIPTLVISLTLALDSQSEAMLTLLNICFREIDQTSIEINNLDWEFIKEFYNRLYANGEVSPFVLDNDVFLKSHPQFAILLEIKERIIAKTLEVHGWKLSRLGSRSHIEINGLQYSVPEGIGRIYRIINLFETSVTPGYTQRMQLLPAGIRQLREIANEKIQARNEVRLFKVKSHPDTIAFYQFVLDCIDQNTLQNEVVLRNGK